MNIHMELSEVSRDAIQERKVTRYLFRLSGETKVRARFYVAGKELMTTYLASAHCSFHGRPLMLIKYL